MLVVELLVVMSPLVMLLLCSVVWAPLVVNPLLDSATVVAVALESACSLLVVQPLSVLQLHSLLSLGLQVEALLIELLVLVWGLSKGMHWPRPSTVCCTFQGILVFFLFSPWWSFLRSRWWTRWSLCLFQAKCHCRTLAQALVRLWLLEGGIVLSHQFQIGEACDLLPIFVGSLFAHHCAQHIGWENIQSMAGLGACL